MLPQWIRLLATLFSGQRRDKEDLYDRVDAGREMRSDVKKTGSGPTRSQGVQVNKPVRGKVKMKAVETLDGAIPIPLRGLARIKPDDTYVVSLTADQVRRHLVAPGERTDGGDDLVHETEPSWPRDLTTSVEAVSEPLGTQLPIFVSPRDKWSRKGGVVELFDRARVLLGAHRLAIWLAACESPDEAIDVIALSGLDVESEVAIYRRSVPPPGTGSSKAPAVPTLRKPALEHLQVTTAWREIRIDDEPFVIPSPLGYGVATIVTDDRLGQRLLYLNARSLSQPFEIIRQQNGKLTGVTVRIRKLSEERTAKFEVESDNPQLSLALERDR